MKNELFRIGDFTIYGYGLMIGIGVIAAYLVSEYRAKKRELDTELLIPIAIWVLVPGFVCAKLLYYITIWEEILQTPGLLLDFSDGFVVYGGIIGGIIGGFVYCRVYNIEFFKYFDLVMPSVALAQGFGRIGCFLAGCCYGLQMDSPFSIVFKESGLAPNGVPLLPTQLLSSALNFIHFFILIAFAKRAKAPGQVSSLYLICYSAGRFALEFLRGDLERGAVGTLSTSQFISIFVFILGCALFAVNTIREKKAVRRRAMIEKAMMKRAMIDKAKREKEKR